MKKITSFLISFCVILTIFSFHTFAIDNAQGYAIYRDGAGINPDWHSGFIYDNLYDTNKTVIHVDNGENGDDTSTDHLINYVSLSDFIDNQQFFGYYIPINFTYLSEHTINPLREEVIETAYKLQELTKDELSYNLLYQVWYKKDKDSDGKVDIDEITSMRCDGFIEYCYELNNAPIYEDNISRFDTTIRNNHSAVNITPETQSTIYMHNCLGDLNYDYEVTAADARLALQYSAHTADYDTYQGFVADVNGDEIITAADSRLILQYTSYEIVYFPADPILNS